MMTRAIVGLVLSLSVSIDGLAQNQEKYLVAIDLQGRVDVGLLERLQLPD